LTGEIFVEDVLDGQKERAVVAEQHRLVGPSKMTKMMSPRFLIW